MITSKALQANLYVSVNQDRNGNLGHLPGAGLEQINVPKSSSATRGQVCTHTRPFSITRPPPPVAESRTATGRLKLPPLTPGSQAPGPPAHPPPPPHSPSSKGVPSGLRREEAEHSVTARAARLRRAPAARSPDSPEDDGVPHHDVVLGGGAAHAGRGVLLQPAGHSEG